MESRLHTGLALDVEHVQIIVVPDWSIGVDLRMQERDTLIFRRQG